MAVAAEGKKAPSGNQWEEAFGWMYIWELNPERGCVSNG